MNQNMIYDVSYMDALKRGFKQYVTFSGRTSRSEFWRFSVSSWIWCSVIHRLPVIMQWSY